MGMKVLRCSKKVCTYSYCERIDNASSSVGIAPSSEPLPESSQWIELICHIKPTLAVRRPIANMNLLSISLTAEKNCRVLAKQIPVESGHYLTASC